MQLIRHVCCLTPMGAQVGLPSSTRYTNCCFDFLGYIYNASRFEIEQDIALDSLLQTVGGLSESAVILVVVATGMGATLRTALPEMQRVFELNGARFA